MNNTNRRRHLVSGGIAGVVSVLLLIGVGWVYFNRQYVADTISYWTYQPSTAVAAIDERVDFTDKGTFYFYVTHPEIADASSFNQDCPRQEANNPILGCYAMDRVYIYDITNQALDGIEEVTAAHEMLHAVWSRMDNQQKNDLTALLMDDYKTIDSVDLRERIAYYERHEPGELANELHSILATEVASLTPALEEYYQQYFEDRQKVVALHEQYDRLFQDLKNQANQLYEELDALSRQITADSEAYNNAVNELEADIVSFNQQAAAGGFTSQAAFQAARSSLIARSNALDAQRAAINQAIDTYNQKYQEYQQIGQEIEALNKSIDSFTAPQEAPSL